MRACPNFWRVPRHHLPRISERAWATLLPDSSRAVKCQIQIGQGGDRRRRLGRVAVAAMVIASMLVAVRTAPASRCATALVDELRNITYVRRGALPLRLDAFMPTSRAPHPGVVVVHGGGWTAGSRMSTDLFAHRLADAGFDAFSIDYRLAPRYHYPDAEQDVRIALTWLRTHARRFDLDAKRLALLGFSAGANLALDVGLSGRPHPQVAAIAAWSAPTDLRKLFEETANRYVVRSLWEYIGCSVRRCPQRYQAASPTTALSPGAPPILLINSTHEIIPLAQARELARDAERAHVPVDLIAEPGTRHAAAYASRAWAPTVAFLRRYLR